MCPVYSSRYHQDYRHLDYMLSMQSRFKMATQTIANDDIGDEKLKMNSCQLAVSCSYLEANF